MESANQNSDFFCSHIYHLTVIIVHYPQHLSHFVSCFAMLQAIAIDLEPVMPLERLGGPQPTCHVAVFVF
jgi:hypothetical protein